MIEEEKDPQIEILDLLLMVLGGHRYLGRQLIRLLFHVSVDHYHEPLVCLLVLQSRILAERAGHNLAILNVGVSNPPSTNLGHHLGQRGNAPLVFKSGQTRDKNLFLV